MYVAVNSQTREFTATCDEVLLHTCESTPSFRSRHGASHYKPDMLGYRGPEFAITVKTVINDEKEIIRNGNTVIINIHRHFLCKINVSHKFAAKK